MTMSSANIIQRDLGPTSSVSQSIIMKVEEFNMEVELRQSHIQHTPLQLCSSTYHSHKPTSDSFIQFYNSSHCNFSYNTWATSLQITVLWSSLFFLIRIIHQLLAIFGKQIIVSHWYINCMLLFEFLRMMLNLGNLIEIKLIYGLQMLFFLRCLHDCTMVISTLLNLFGFYLLVRCCEATYTVHNP